jgi:long-chain acyl-CoA synthetase
MLPDVKRVVVLCPVHHIYGFIWGALLPEQLQVPVVDLSLDAIAPGFLNSGDLVVATPPVWRLLAQSGYRFSAGITGVTSTAPMPAEVAYALTGNGLATLYQIYGSSETAGLAWRTAPEAAYTVADFWLKPDASETKVTEATEATAADQLARACPDGEYRLFAVMDQLAWVDARSFHVTGRLDQAVQVAGHNVSLANVEAHIKTNPAVRDCAVRTFTVPGAEQRLKAFIVLTADTIEARHAFAFWLHETLPAHTRPRALSFGDALPVNAMGKRADWDVNASMESASA